MPSACTKLENKASQEASDSVKQCIVIVEKKIRNMEKRRQKLDLIRDKFKEGEKLNEDQRDAIAKYDAVITNLEFAKELQKQFQSISVDIEKMMKKKEKRDRKERQDHEMSRIKELLQLQSLLDNMGSEEVRADFSSGSKGAVQLSEENLTQLDELYKLISPSRDGEVSYANQLTKASEHIVNFLDGREKEVVGTTYKELNEMVAKVHSCGYFDNLNKAAEEEAEEEEDKPASDDSSDQEIEAPAEDPVEEAFPSAPEEDIPAVDPPVDIPEPHIAMEPVSMAPTSVPTPTHTETLLSTDTTPLPTHHPVAVSMPTGMVATHPNYEEQDSFFLTENAMARPGRGFQEIVSSVQGSFNFLQESQIELENSQVAADPAVVAARPMAPSHTHSSDVNLSQATYQASSLMSADEQYGSVPPQQSDPNAAVTSLDSLSPEQQLVSAAQSQEAAASQYSVTDTGDFTHSQQTSVDSPYPSTDPFSQQLDFGASSQAHYTDQEKKTFTMNPNADPFQSSIYPQQQQQPGMTRPPQIGQSPEAFSHESSPSAAVPKTYAQNAGNNDYSSGYGASNFGQQGNNRNRSSQDSRTSAGRGAQPSTQGSSRGGGRPGGPINNGYQRNSMGNSTGGGANNRNSNGPYNNANRTGGYQNNRGGGRGGGGSDRYQGGQGFQNYPPRNDYRQDGGYQGYNNNYNMGGSAGGGGGQGGSFSSTWNKQPQQQHMASRPMGGSRGGSSGGPPRGSGGMRGGRGGNSTGFNRQNNPPPQTMA